ncbi:MAG: hypothetical protein ABW101_02830 [Candidatus Thiodiazotropha sp.]
MKKEYGKALRQLFARRMKADLPQFRETKVKSLYLFPGERAYLWAVSEQLHCWVVLSPSPKDYDEFTLLIGWSTHGRYPELSCIPSMQSPTADRAEFAKHEYLIRLPMLWTDKGDWWVVRPFKPARSNKDLLAQVAPIAPDEALRQTQPRVDEAIEQLKSHGIPYLQAFVDACELIR